MSAKIVRAAFAAAALAAAMGSASQAQTILGPISNPFNGHTYYAVRIANFADYQAQATALGGYPLVVNNAAENAWVFTNVVSALPAGEYAYMGFTDVAIEGEWRWDAKVVDRYTNWAPGEPNNFANAQDWAVFRREQNGRWDDWVMPGPYTVGGNPNQILPAAIVEVNNGTNPDPAGILYGPVNNPAIGSDYHVLAPGNFLAAGRFAASNLPAGALLASIETPEENLWITNNLLSQPGVGTAWIGLNTFYQADMAWVNASTGTYRRWASGEPSGNGLHGTVMQASSTPSPGLWFDAFHTDNFPSIIEVRYCRTDFDRSGASNLDDIFIFLNAWFAGCP